MNTSLEQLIKKCKQGDRKAQEEIYKEFSALLFSVCLRYNATYEDAQDAFQEGFILVFKKINQFNFTGSFEGWIRRLMVNNCLEKLRKKPSYFTSDELEDVMDITEDGEQDVDKMDYEVLLSCVQQLPPQYRQVFNLAIFEGYSHQEIAEILTISVGTSKSNLSRARAILKDKINTLTQANSQ